MKRAALLLKSSFIAVWFLSCSSVYAATAGLPFTEDFSAQDLMDAGQTSANWSLEEQAVYQSWHKQRLAHFATAGVALGSETDTTFAVTLGDVDGDGDLDLVVGNDGGQTNKLYLNETCAGRPSCTH